MGAIKRAQPRGCKGHYIPWVCGTCGMKMACKPSTPTMRAVKRKKVRA